MILSKPPNVVPEVTGQPVKTSLKHKKQTNMDNPVYPRLVQALERMLMHTGFWRFPYMDYFVRVRGDVRDVIGWRLDENAVPGAGRRYAIYFGVWVPEFETSLNRSQVDETSHIRNMDFMHDLSPQAAQRLSFWWKEDDMSLRQEDILRRQIQQVALPYFDTFASFGDVAEMVFYDQRFHNSDLEQRLMNHSDAAFFHYEMDQASEQVVSALKPLQKLAPAFQYANGVFWRQRHEVFDAIVPHYFANWRFVQIRTMVWHPALDGMEHIPQSLPAGFSHVAWRSFNERGRDASELPPAFLGEPADGPTDKHLSSDNAAYMGSSAGAAQESADAFVHTTLASQMEGLRSFGLAWLESIHSRQDVFNAVRPEFKKFYPD